MPSAIQLISTHSFAALPRWVSLGSAWVTAAVIGWTDYVTGMELSLFALYAVPIFMAVWFGTWRGGLLMAAGCTLIWWFANRADSTFTTWWGYHIAAASRLALFI